MTIQSPMLLGLGALALAACALADASTRTTAALRGPEPPAASLSCALRLIETRGGLSARAELRAPAATAGRYALRLRRGAGLVLDQGGDFSARAGETLTLGQAMLSGGVAGLDAGLTVQVGGRDVTCPVLRQ